MRAERRQRESAANRLRQANHIRRHAKVFRSAAPAEFCARLDFVEDQQRAVLIAERPQPFQKSFLRHAEANVHHDRFQDDGRHFIRILSEPAFHRFQIIERSNQHICDARLRHTGPARHRFRILDIAEIVGRRMRFHAYQRCIVQSVVATFKLDDFVASSRGAGKTNGVHGGFRAAVAEAAHLDRKTRADFFRQFPFQVVRHAVSGALVQSPLHGFDHGRMRMPRHERSKT